MHGASDDPPLAEGNREWPADEGDQELGEESEQEEDPLIEFVGGEPDAETGPLAARITELPSESNGL